MAEIATAFRKPFAEQQAALRLRLQNLVPTQSWTDRRHNDHDREFVVAGAMKADLLADLGAAIEKAVTKGTTYDEFRRDFKEIVARRGWTGWKGEGSEKGEAWRTRVIFRTNMLTSYAAARRAQLIAGKYPIWVYRHSGAEHPRLHHLAWDGVALPVDHPFWATHSPPNGWGCGCEIYGARSDAGVRRIGGDPSKQLPDGWQNRDARGDLSGIDTGWDYAPGATTYDAILTLKDKLPKLPAQIGSRMFADWPNAGPSLDAEFAKFVDTSLSEFVQHRHMVIGALKPKWVDEAIKMGVKPESAEIAVTDRDVQHTFRGTDYVTAPSTRRSNRLPKVDPLDLEWYKSMPSRLRNPRAVLLDTSKSEPVFLLIYDTPSATTRLVIEINTYLKKAKTVMNTMQTGRLITLNDLRADMGNGVALIDGRI